MTLDELERPLRTLFHNTCLFGSDYEILNKDRRTVTFSSDDVAQWL